LKKGGISIFLLLSSSRLIGGGRLKKRAISIFILLYPSRLIGGEGDDEFKWIRV